MVESPDRKLIQLLRSVDTPTVCNAIEVAQGKRGFEGFTRATVLAADAALPPICGYARTASIRGKHPPEDSPAKIRERRMAYYRYMAESPEPSVTVIEDLDGFDAVGAFWGEINSNVHAAFGLKGALTNGVMRDLGDLAPGFQVIAGSIGPSHAFVHVVDFDVPVSVFGLEVKPGDLVHADRHGAVVVPDKVINGLGKAIINLQASEALVLVPARQPNMTFASFEKAWASFEKARI